MTNLRQLPFPKIQSGDDQILRNLLISNSEQIIQLAKNLQSVKNWRDILDIGFDGLDETVRGMKSDYLYMAEFIGDVETLEKGSPIPKDIFKILRENSPQMKQLESQRDAIVEKLYSL